MADIHILPARTLSGAAMQRLTEQLMQAREAGVELGSRVPHIHAAAPVCRDKARELRQAAQELHPSNPAHKLFDAAAEEILLSLADAIERLADLAADFPQQNQ